MTWQPILKTGPVPKENLFLHSSGIEESPFRNDPASPRLSNHLAMDHGRPSSTASATVNTLEELQLRIANGAMEIRAARADSMSVALRPDTRTELTLQLKIQNGLVEVEARMQKGDFTSLQAHWGLLQQNLSHQGIRLATLSSQDALGQPDQQFSHGNGPTRHADQDQNHTRFQDRPKPSEQGANLQSHPGDLICLRAVTAKSQPNPLSEFTSSQPIQRDSTRGFWESWA